MNFLEKEDIREYYTDFLSYVRMNGRSVYTAIDDNGTFEDSTKATLDRLLHSFKENYIVQHPEYQEAL